MEEVGRRGLCPYYNSDGVCTSKGITPEEEHEPHEPYYSLILRLLENKKINMPEEEILRGYELNGIGLMPKIIPQLEEMVKEGIITSELKERMVELYERRKKKN